MNPLNSVKQNSEGLDPSVGAAELYSADVELESPEQAQIEKSFAAEFLEKFPQFKDLLGNEETLRSHTAFIGRMPRTEQFKALWESGVNREELIYIRRFWVSMKEKGEEFTGAFEEMMVDLLETPNFGTKLFLFIKIHKSLGSPTAIEFYGKLLSDQRVWNLHDGSITHNLLESLENTQDPQLKELFLDHIGHILSPGYRRIDHRSNDLSCVVDALQKTCGEEAFSVLDAYAEESASFLEWWEKKKVSLLITQDFVKAQPKAVPTAQPTPFDVVKEKEYLQKLEQEIAERPHVEVEIEEKNLSTHYGHLDFDEMDDLGDLPEDDDLTVPRQLEDQDRVPYQKRVINFYGRFRPKVEHPVPLNETNLTSALCWIVKNGGGGHEEYLRLLSGAAEEGELLEQIPETLSPIESRAFVRAACARITFLGTIERNVEQARSELKEVENFLRKTMKSNEIQLSHELARLFDLKIQLERAANAEEPPALPSSASPFFVYHQKRKKMREIPAFTELLKEKMKYLTAMALSGKEGVSWSIERIESEYRYQYELYRTIEREDVPVYWEAKERLDDVGANRCVVFGRDGKYLFTALKAGDFGSDERELKYVLLTRNIQNQETRETIARYLGQQGIELDSYFVDTGYAGSIPELAIRSLAEAGGVEISDGEIDRRIKLLSSSGYRRQSIAGQELRRRGDVVSRIEDRPLAIESPSYYQITPEGKLLPEEQPTPANMQLAAWVIEHAVMRNFAPRFEPKERLRTPPLLEGHRFLERFSGGAVVGTHPLELWETPNERKVLLKGGPEHTLRADYVGSRLFGRIGVKTAESDLLRTEDGLKLKMDYLEGWEDGPLSLPERFHNSEEIQAGFFTDLLLQQYDRTSWNMMFNEDSVAFIDHGAGLHSRARGGYKGFPAVVTAENLAEVLEHPERQGKVVNEAYGALVEFKDRKIVDQNTGKVVVGKKLVIKNKLRVERLFRHFSTSYSSSFIGKVIDEAGFSDGRRVVEELERTLEKLKSELALLSPDSRDAQKHRGAIETIGQMIAAGGEAAYLKDALVRRLDGIANLFSQALREGEG